MGGGVPAGRGQGKARQCLAAARGSKADGDRGRALEVRGQELEGRGSPNLEAGELSVSFVSFDSVAHMPTQRSQIACVAPNTLDGE